MRPRGGNGQAEKTVFTTTDKISLSGIKKVVFSVSTNTGYYYGDRGGFFISNEKSPVAGEVEYPPGVVSTVELIRGQLGLYIIDVTSINGEFYIGGNAQGYQSGGTTPDVGINQIYLEA